MPDTSYYERPVLLNREKHRHQRLRPATGFGFARRSHALFVAGVEFTEACKEYAIVFARVDGKVQPVVLLGLRDGENLFVDAQERWTAAYVPAFVRRYPFVLAELPGEQMGVCIDEGFPGLNDKEGEPLFDAEGADTPFLRNALEFLQRYQQEHLRTLAFCRRLEESGVLVEMNARADLVDGRTFSITGLMVVDERKLQALPDATALAMLRAGEMHLVSMHLLSLSNMNRLADRVAQRSGPAAVPAPAAAASASPAPAPVSAGRRARAGTKPG